MAEQIRVELRWKGIFQLAYVDYTVHPDDFMREMAKKVKDLPDPDLDRKGFWFLVSAAETPDEEVEIEELLFIGSSYNTDLRDRIPDRRLKNVYRDVMAEARNNELYFAYGYIGDISTASPPRKLITDLECALVFQNEPICNNRCQDRYTSEEGSEFLVTNVGDFFPLEANCDTLALRELE